MKRKALGKGLDALFGGPISPSAVSGLVQIPLEEIRPNDFQPRLQIQSETLSELAESIKENGVLQPVIVRRAAPGPGFELVAGERRWRAAQLAGLERIPALVQDLSDERALEVALVENIQRDELSAIEEAQAYQLLLDRFSLTQEEIAVRVGRSRTAVANTLRLLKLPKPIQGLVVAGQLSMGHARALLPLAARQQHALAREIMAKGLSVRQVERRIQSSQQPARRSRAPLDPNTRAAVGKLEHAWKTKVEIRRHSKGGRIILHFFSEEELQRLYEGLLSAVE